MDITSSVGSIKRRVLYAQAIYGQPEVDAVVESLKNGWLASGVLVAQFEEEIARLFGKKYGIAVNSGSSANLLAIKALDMTPGGEIITPACTFATTVSEIINNGFVPVFVDSVVGRYTINEDLVEKAITPRTVAILVPQLIGGVCDMERLREIAKRYSLRLIDDSCDTLAPMLHGKSVASYADVSTTSFYGSHIITACGMGGMIMTDDIAIRDKAIRLRDWGRVGNDSEEFNSRFDFELDGIPYDSKFLYSEFGYNLKMNESAAAFGLEQLKRLPTFVETKNKNFKRLMEIFGKYPYIFHLPELIEGATTNWLAFPVTIKEGSPIQRIDLLRKFESDGIQTRVLFSGNITRHPVYQENKFDWVQSSDLTVSDYIMGNGFLIGCHQGMTDEHIDIIEKSFEEFMHDIAV